MPSEGRARRVLTGVACILGLRPFNLIFAALQVLFFLIRLSVVESVFDKFKKLRVANAPSSITTCESLPAPRANLVVNPPRGSILNTLGNGA